MKPGTQADVIRELKSEHGITCSGAAISKLVSAKDYRIVKTPKKKINVEATVKALIDSGFGKRSKKIEKPETNKDKGWKLLPPVKGEPEPTNGESKDFDPTKPLSLEDKRETIEKHKAFHQSEKERILNEIKLGNYYEKSEINEKSFDLFRMMRDGMQSVTERIAVKCRAAESDHEARKITRDEVHNILSSIVEGYNLDDEAVKKKIMLHLT